MKGLMFAGIFAVAFAAVAADPSWPADFDSKLQEHIETVIVERTTSESAVCDGEFDPRALTEGVTPGYGSAAAPFDPRAFTWGISNCIGLDTSMPGFLLFMR